MHDYKTFCVKNKLKYSGQSIKMWTDYCEVSKASTDMKDDMTNYGSITMSPGTWAISTNCVSLAPNYPQVCTVPCEPAKAWPNKKEKTMYVDNDKHIESSKINYLSNRVETLYYKKQGEMQKLFGFVNDEPPETATEMVKRIQDGKFVIKDEVKDKRTYGDAARYITWKDPSVKEDKDGLKAAQVAFDIVHRDAQDAVAILSPVDGLAALKTLEAWTPTAK